MSVRRTQSVPNPILSFGTGEVCRWFEDLGFWTMALLLRRPKLASVDGGGGKVVERSILVVGLDETRVTMT